MGWCKDEAAITAPISRSQFTATHIRCGPACNTQPRVPFRLGHAVSGCISFNILHTSRRFAAPRILWSSFYAMMS